METGAAFSLSPGELVAGRYRITRVIGRGGMGAVYEAEDELLKEAVALKTLRADLAHDESLAGRFRKEVQLARKITHPNVCRVFETGLHERMGEPPLPFFIMELLEGETLSARIQRLSRLSWEEASAIAVQVAEGLQAAHDAGIVHADFKSGNVILVPAADRERAVITDFGLSRIDSSTASADETWSLLPEGSIVGTAVYMSPEQLTGGPVTAASDIYSFGVVLFEMATGALPFDSQHAIQAAVQKVVTDTVSARRLVPNIDSRWDAAISRCLQRDPRGRFRSARELAGCLRQGEWRTDPRYWTRRDWVRAGVIVGIPAAAAGGYWKWSRRPHVPAPGAIEWYQKGVAALHSMSYDAARRAFEQAVAIDPGFALAHASLARAYEELDYSDLARESMLRALAVAGESHLSTGEARKIRAFHLLISHDYDRAVPVFQQLEATASPSEKPAAALEYGWLAQQRGDSDGAARAYERALKLDPRYAAAKLRLGFILGRRRKLDAALKAFQEAEVLYNASSNYEGVTETLYQRAMLLIRSSRAADAMRVLDKALLVASAVSNPYQQIRLQLAQGVAFRYLGDTARASTLARDAIDRAVAGHMDNLAAAGLIDLGNAYLVQGEDTSAEPYYRRALDLAQRGKVTASEARARLALGALYEQEHRLGEARQFLEAALPFYRQAGYRRELVQAVSILGGVHQQRAEYDEGVRVLREVLPSAVQLQDSVAEAGVRERLAENLRDQGAWPEALNEFERAAALWGARGASARLNCAALYSRIGRSQDAEQSLANAEALLKRMPDEEQLARARILRVRMAYQDGRLSEASQLIRDLRASGIALDGRAETEVRLLDILLRIRSSKGDQQLGPSGTVLQRFKDAGLLFEGAAARLDIAEACMRSAQPLAAVAATAREYALQAGEFFRPRRIWEALWRVHWTISKAALSAAEAAEQKRAAREALATLATIWPSPAMEGYLRRPDINPLAFEVRS